jgi:hypothetical protein
LRPNEILFRMWKIERDILMLGGVARRSELLNRGHSRDVIDLLASYGTRIICVRKGWYATPDFSPEVTRAWHLGGRLACVSAAAHHGLALPDDGLLHISVPRNASRLGKARPRVVRHWTDTRSLENQPPIARRSVDIEEAIRQILVCAAASGAATALASKLRWMPGRTPRDSL